MRTRWLATALLLAGCKGGRTEPAAPPSGEVAAPLRRPPMQPSPQSPPPPRRVVAAPPPAVDAGPPPSATGLQPKITFNEGHMLDQTAIYYSGLPAISTDGKLVAYSREHQGASEIALRPVGGGDGEVLGLLSAEELKTAKNEAELTNTLRFNIAGAEARLATTPWIALIGGEGAETGASGLTAKLDRGKLQMKTAEGGIAVFDGELLKAREACEKPSVQGIWRDPGSTLALVQISHSQDECQPQAADEHHLVGLTPPR